ncbi:MAG: MmgE/PrpD family protein [Rhodobacter sp.]|nr:MmgE/PrpD family protein [Rhodobacter sp.]
MDALTFIHALRWDDLPPQVRLQGELNLLDLLGIAIGGRTTRLSDIINTHAASQFGGNHAMLFDARPASAAGFALAAGMTIDALDGHDGYNPAKGHVGCGLFPAALACALEAGQSDGRAFLTTIALGYELGSRLGPALHATTPDYHTSGAWIAVAAAAAGARLLRLDSAQTAHALGIAEYHGPRSQMMRCIDHPTMLKDGSGWGAMAGVSAALLARDGFTGAPALTLSDPPALWADLGDTWLTTRQYYKPYPVCRWAQSPIEAALALRARHDLRSTDIAAIEIATFHEATRLATAAPQTTEEAQYSTSFPTAVALVRRGVGPADITGDALYDPEILRLSRATTMIEDDTANAAFPHRRLGRVALTLRDGTRLESPLVTPKWDADAPPSEADLRGKFHDLADPIIGSARANAIEAGLHDLPARGLMPLYDRITQPISDATTSARSA